MNQFEKTLQHKLQNEAVSHPDPELLWSRIQTDRYIRKGSTTVRIFPRIAVTVSALLVIVVIGSIYGQQIVSAASNLFHQVFGSIANVKQFDPNAEEGAVEADLRSAQAALTESEFRQYTALIKEQMNLLKEAIEVMDGQQKIYMERLTNEEKTKLYEIEQELGPLMSKIDKHFVYSMDEAAKKLPFPVKRPGYIPVGYSLQKEEAKSSSRQVTAVPIVSLTYKQTDGEFGFIIRQSAVLTGDDDEYSKRVSNWDHEESYNLNGNEVHFAREGKNVTMLKMIVPAKGTLPSYQIFIIADILSKDEVEKITLSMLGR